MPGTERAAAVSTDAPRWVRAFSSTGWLGNFFFLNQEQILDSVKCFFKMLICGFSLHSVNTLVILTVVLYSPDKPQEITMY